MVEPPTPDTLLSAIETALALEPPAGRSSSLVEAVAAALGGAGPDRSGPYGPAKARSTRCASA